MSYYPTSNNYLFWLYILPYIDSGTSVESSSHQIIFLLCFSCFFFILCLYKHGSFILIDYLYIYIYIYIYINPIHEEIKCKHKAEKACYYSIQILSHSRLLSEKFKIKVYETTVSSLVLCDHERDLLHCGKKQAEDRPIWKQDPEENIWARRDENEEWRRLHNKKFHSFFRSPK